MKRFLKIVAILALFVLVVAYVAFRAVFFDPFGGPRASLDPLVPKDVHFMVRRAELARDFSAFPMPRAFANLRLKDEWKSVVATRWYRDHVPSAAIEEAFAALGELPAQIAPLDLMLDFAGREVLVCGRWKEDGALAWAAIARGSFRAKLFAEAVRLSFVRKTQGDLISAYEEQDDVSSLTVAGTRWHLARVDDALIAGNDFELVREMRQLDGGEGLSLDDSPQYRTAVLSPSPLGRPVDYMVDVKSLCQRLGIAALAATANDPLFVRYVSELLDPACFGAAMGRLALGHQIEWSSAATIDRSSLVPRAGGLLDGASGDLAGSWSFCGKVFPAKVAVAGHLRLDVRQMLRRLEGLMEPDLRKLLNEEFIPNLRFKAGQFQPKSTVELLDAFAAVVGDEIAFAFEPDEAYSPPGVDAGTVIYPNPKNGPRIALVFPAADRGAAQQFVDAVVDALRGRPREIPNVWTWSYPGFDEIKFHELKTIDDDLPPFGIGLLELQKRPCVVFTTTGAMLNEICVQKMNVESGRNVGLQTELQFRQAQEAVTGFGQGFCFVSSERLRKVIEDLCIVFAEEQTRPDWTTIRRGVERDVVRDQHPELKGKALDEAARRKIEPAVDAIIEAKEREWREQTLPARAEELRKDLAGLAIFRWLTLALAVDERELDLRLRIAAPIDFDDRLGD